ncbi:MAG: twin-arginine translocase TatA/TatE family subunit [Spirochaetales bacterium]|nr:twin-arginine translocase TatA/TatE family subunit [Leptospiraceae bacterium]MCP5481263.1 twin-arginine translocase TatA/TatE family subunit [Spirochaetales bacterium]MCP5485699.1 twin-arginine translocase TatA/TatE family subunit [Spirochaetales bacterium]
MSVWEIGLVVLLALLLFGSRKLPQLARDLGSGITEFRKSLTGKSEDDQSQEEQEPARKSGRGSRTKAKKNS